MTSGEIGTNHLAYHVIFKCTQHLESHYVYVDAHNGAVLNSFCPDARALNRTAILFGKGTVYTEGSSLPDDAQAKLVVQINGVQYNAMMNVGGYDSWDLNGTYQRIRSEISCCVLYFETKTYFTSTISSLVLPHTTCSSGFNTIADPLDLGGEFKNTINVPTNGYPQFICPNAAFYGAPIGALYCPGFAYGIDVIAHEFGHGYIRGSTYNTITTKL